MASIIANNQDLLNALINIRIKDSEHKIVFLFKPFSYQAKNREVIWNSLYTWSI